MPHIQRSRAGISKILRGLVEISTGTDISVARDALQELLILLLDVDMHLLNLLGDCGWGN